MAALMFKLWMLPKPHPFDALILTVFLLPCIGLLVLTPP